MNQEMQIEPRNTMIRRCDLAKQYMKNEHSLYEQYQLGNLRHSPVEHPSFPKRSNGFEVLESGSTL